MCSPTDAKTLILPSPMDTKAHGILAGETPLYPRGDPPPSPAWQNPMYNFSVSLDGVSQYLESMDIPYTCLLTLCKYYLLRCSVGMGACSKYKTSLYTEENCRL